MTVTAALKWVRKSSGKACWYETECQRFSMSPGRRRGEWVLMDRQTKDPVTPEFNRMETVYRLEHGRNKAARWAAGKAY